MSESLDVRFFSKVRMTSLCWQWLGARTKNGYGLIWCEGRTAVAHRVAYERVVGSIPHGLQLDHLCRNRACVRPDHLEPVTNRENVLRGNTIVAACAAKTHCDNGHPLTGENIRVKVRRDGVERVCVQCNRACERRRYLRRKALGSTPQDRRQPKEASELAVINPKEPALPEGQR